MQRFGRDDDAFWAARRVAGFSDKLIRAAVHTGQFSNPAAEQYLGDVLIKRRDKIASVYLTAINPIVDPRLVDGRLTVGNAAQDAGVASGAATYRASWFQFDNATGDTRPLADTVSATTTLNAPANLASAAGAFIGADLSIESTGHPTWQQPVRSIFRRDGNGWTLVGLERQPDARPDRLLAQHRTR